jgi:membrane-associated phospholipid phosphatase
MRAAVLSPALSAAQQGLRDSLRTHSWLLLAIAAYGAAAAAVVPSLGVTPPLSFSLYWPAFSLATPIFLAVFLVGRVCYLMAAHRPPRPLRYLLDDARRNLLRPERLLVALPILLALPLFLSVFSSLKSLIPVIQPFAWDATFAGWDKALHFGRHPWEWLQPVLGHPYVTTAINLFYHLWFFLMYGLWVWQAFSTRDPLLRMRFFLSFVLVWALLGSVAATALSSAGPCYFGRITGLEDPYAGLMAYLRDSAEVSPVWALGIQDLLWSNYLRPGVEVGSGITAMPSMHVATAVLFALFGARVDRRLGIALWAYAAIIGIGSVHLGWHYAIDGYAGALGAVAIWKAVGWLLARNAALRSRVAPPALPGSGRIQAI